MAVPFFRRTFRITRHRPDVPRDVAEEIDFYLDMRTRELVERGVAPEEARRQAEAAFGDRGGIERECSRLDEPSVRERRRAELTATVLGDVGRAFRNLRRRPTFALAACLILATCVALNTAVFAVVQAILLAPLPYPGSDRLVAVFDSYPKAGFPRVGNTVPDYFDRRAAVTAFEEVALYQRVTRSVGEPGTVRRIACMVVTPSFFRVLGVEPLLGRTFLEDETEPGNGDPAVISFDLWQQRFAGDPAVVGERLRVEGVSHTVVGVMPEGFSFPGWRARLWLPQVFTEEQRSHQGRYDPFFEMLARLRPGAPIDRAQEQLDAWNEALIARLPSGLADLVVAVGVVTRIVGFHDDLVRDVESWLYLLWGGALFVLLIGGASLTNLHLMRSAGRVRELATRHMLGASRGRLTRQLLTESLLLGLVGGVPGILAGAFSLRLLDVFSSFQLPRVSEVGLRPAAAALILLLAIAVMLVASLVSALAVHRLDLGSIPRAGSCAHGRGSLRLQGALAAAQIAVACILLIGAALMSVSLWKLLAIDPGFDSSDIFAGAVSLPEARYPDPADRHRFYDAALAEIRSLPGVRSAAIASQLPLSGDPSEEGMLTPEGRRRRPGDGLLTHSQTTISPGYFSTLGIPLLAGRRFDERDDGSSQPVMIVSEAVAKRYWNGAADTPGQRVYLGREPFVGEALPEGFEWHTVVGVVGDVVQADLTDGSRRGAFYLAHRQQDRRFARLVVKTEARPADLASAVQDRFFALDPEIVLWWVTTLEESVADTLIAARIAMQLLLIFAAVALLLAAVGVYGVLEQTVAHRAREIGIRMALGSSLEQIYRWVFGNMLVFIATGLLLGLAGALCLTHLMTDLLHGVRPTDPAVFVAVGVVIGGVALLAAAIPARRATGVDPVDVLTSE